MDRGIAGETITAGQPVYKNSADSNRLYRSSALVLAQAQVVGIALHGASAGQPLAYATGGDINLGGSTMVLGTVYVVSGANVGGIAPSADLDAGTTWYATVLGVSSSATNLKLALRQSNTVNP